MSGARGYTTEQVAAMIDQRMREQIAAVQQRTPAQKAASRARRLVAWRQFWGYVADRMFELWLVEQGYVEQGYVERDVSA